MAMESAGEGTSAAGAEDVTAVFEDIPAVVAKPLPKVESETTADEEKFDCPQPWYLALLTVAMSAMTSITVAGSLFFLLAAPEKVSPHCFEHESPVTRWFCTASTIAFWTYPVVCCLFVVLVFAKNLVDQRTFYEFLLHRVVIGYGRVQAWKNPVVVALLLYALMAFSALVWYHYSHTDVLVGHVYASLAYITPIISFLAVIFAQWSIQGKLITLPNFLEDYGWGVSHLNGSRCYSMEQLHQGYNCLEAEMDQSDEIIDTPRMVALVEEYTKKARSVPEEDDDIEASKGAEAEAAKGGEKKKTVADEAKLILSEAEERLVREARLVKEYIYWEVRLLFNPRLQDDRSQSFRNWALAYMVSVFLAVLLSVYIFFCCLITCLEIERVLVPNTPTWGYTHYFSLRPDLGGASQHKSLKQVAASVAMSAVQTGTREFYNRAAVGTHFQLGFIGAAA
jgi:hypothetical protein